MKKEDFLDLLKVIDSVRVLEKGCVILSGKGFEDGTIVKRNLRGEEMKDFVADQLK